jgi:N-acetyl-anhydromuramyl-L-alanine amidase AmpD
MEIAAELRQRSKELVEVALELRGDPEEMLPPYDDISEQMPVNPRPTAPEAWWVRELSQIEGITIHHTLSHSPEATARYVIEKKGRPTLPYHFWVTVEGDCWLCVPLHYGMWHDHTGHNNVNISVGMAGHLHKVQPTGAQMEATVRLVRYLMAEYEIPLEQVQGHNDRHPTTCPGWDAMNWRDRFYEALRNV